ncbi:MAG: hypothetical protein ACOC22_04535 [bacterium]
MTAVKVLDLPIHPNPDIKEKEAHIFEDRIECHPDYVKILKEGLEGLKKGNNHEDSEFTRYSHNK